MQFGLRSLARGAAVMATALFLTSQASADGMFREATIGEPPPLDVMLTTADVASTIGAHIFETLYARDSMSVPQPLLAESETVEDGGKTIIIKLREGVQFHNGKEMTAEDVVASMIRWGEYGQRGPLLMGNAESVEATGTYEVTLKLSAPNAAWKALIADVNGGLGIYPAEIASAATNEPIAQEDYIGTGPYKFKEWRPNRYVELERFDDYASRSEPGDGFAGERIPNFDTIRFIPVPDVGTRVAGVQAGDYDYAEMISGDLYEILTEDPSVVIQKRNAPLFGLFFMNSADGIFKDNYKLRRAVQMALDKAAGLSVAFGSTELWDANGSIFPRGNFWYSEAGIEAYSAHDPEGARALAEEAGYDGTPIRMVVSTNYQAHFDEATVYTQQLAEAGINVQMIVVDWATLLKMRAQPEVWDIFVTHHGFQADPMLFTFLNDTYPGWWTSPEIQELKTELATTLDPDARKAVWDKVQALFYEQVPAMKVGDAFAYDIASPKVKGLAEFADYRPHFWNLSFE